MGIILIIIIVVELPHCLCCLMRGGAPANRGAAIRIIFDLPRFVYAAWYLEEYLASESPSPCLLM